MAMDAGIHWRRDKVKHRLEAVDDPVGCDSGGYPTVVEGVGCSATPWLLFDRGDGIEWNKDLYSTENTSECVCEDVFELECSCRGELFHAAEIDVKSTSDVLARVKGWITAAENTGNSSHGLVLGCAAISTCFLDAMALHLDGQADCKNESDDPIIARYNRHTNRVMLLPNDSIVDFNFGGGVGRARWLQVVHGSVLVCMAPPCASNLREYALWYPTKDTCLSDFLDSTVKIKLHQGDDKVLIVPTGWIVALVCQETCAIVEGVFIEHDALEMEMRVAPHTVCRNSIHTRVIQDSCSQRSKSLYWEIAGLYGDVLIQEFDQSLLLAGMVERKRKELVSFYYSYVSERVKHPRAGIFPEANAPSSNASLNQNQNQHNEPEKNTAESPRTSLKIKLSRSPRIHVDSACPSPKKIRLRLPHTRRKEEQHAMTALDSHDKVELIDTHTRVKLPPDKSKKIACLRQLCVVLQQGSLMQCIQPHAIQARMKSLAALHVCVAECHPNAPMTRDSGSTIFSKQSGDMGCIQIFEDEDVCEHCDETPKATEVHTPFTVAEEKLDDEAPPKPSEKGKTMQIGARAPATKKHASAKQRLAKKLGIKA